jgi:hypothetical protein
MPDLLQQLRRRVRRASAPSHVEGWRAGVVLGEPGGPTRVERGFPKRRKRSAGSMEDRRRYLAARTLRIAVDREGSSMRRPSEQEPNLRRRRCAPGASSRSRRRRRTGERTCPRPIRRRTPSTSPAQMQNVHIRATAITCRRRVGNSTRNARTLRSGTGIESGTLPRASTVTHSLQWRSLGRRPASLGCTGSRNCALM